MHKQRPHIPFCIRLEYSESVKKRTGDLRCDGSPYTLSATKCPSICPVHSSTFHGSNNRSVFLPDATVSEASLCYQFTAPERNISSSGQEWVPIQSCLVSILPWAIPTGTDGQPWVQHPLWELGECPHRTPASASHGHRSSKAISSFDSANLLICFHI